jgi:hypothetical protein
MWCNQIFSLIDRNGVIQNIIVCDNYETANQLAVTLYGESSCAIDTTQYPLQIGYTFKTGRFYRDDDTEVIANPTESQSISLLQGQTASIEHHQAEIEVDLDYRMSMLELGLV